MGLVRINSRRKKFIPNEEQKKRLAAAARAKATGGKRGSVHKPELIRLDSEVKALTDERRGPKNIASLRAMLSWRIKKELDKEFVSALSHFTRSLAA